MTIEELKKYRQWFQDELVDDDEMRETCPHCELMLVGINLIDAEIARKEMDAKYADSYGSVYDALNYATGGFSRKWQLDLLSEVLTYMRPLDTFAPENQTDLRS